MGNYTASNEVMGALRGAAGGSQTHFALLASKAALESGFRPDAQASTSSARGLFQFTEQTWLSMLRQHGAKYGAGAEAATIVSGNGRLTAESPVQRARLLALRDDPQLSANMATEYMREVSDGLAPVLGRRPDAAELYLGHFLGTGGASRMLQAMTANPNQAAANILPQAAAANPSVFNASDGSPLSVAQFIDRLRSRVNRTYANLGLTAPAGPIELGSGGEATATRTAPGEPGGWGNGTPARMQLHAERVVVANLSRVFTKLGRGQEGKQQSVQELPAAVLGALRDAPAPGTPAAATAPSATAPAATVPAGLATPAPSTTATGSGI
jgi:hypothetical protein